MRTVEELQQFITQEKERLDQRVIDNAAKKKACAHGKEVARATGSGHGLSH